MRFFRGARSIALALVAAFFIAGCGSDEKPAGTPQAAAEQPVLASAEGPASTKGEMWEYVVNNAWRTADAYAAERNPSAAFFPAKPAEVEVEFLKQVAGEYQGRYLLKLVSKTAGNTSFAMLLPLFDEFSSSDGLDDEGQLWRVVVAKFNGAPL
jgi:hypothetical protein